MTKAPQLKASEWTYRIEGALHMVLGYTGPSPYYQHKILRLETGDGSITHRPIEEETRFIVQVFGRDLGKYVDAGELISVDEGFLQELKEKVESKRPAERKEKGSIRMDQKVVLVQTDFCKLYSEKPGGTLTMEIKPKCGLLSRSKLVPVDVCERLGKFTTLTYFLKNYKEEDFGDDKVRYSPDDLLSGEKERIEKALDALIYREAHTLRAFHEEHAVFADFLPQFNPPKELKPILDDIKMNRSVGTDKVSESKGWLERLSTKLETCESLGGAKGLRGSDSVTGPSALCKKLYATKALTVGKLALSSASEALEGILKYQALDFVDNLGAECILDRLTSLIGEDNVEQAIWKAHFSYPRSARYKDAVKALSYASPEEGNKLHCEKELQAARSYVEQMDAETAAAILADFLVSGTAKDCSIMVSMCQETDARSTDDLKLAQKNEGCVEVSEWERWRYCMNVVDLEPKAVSRIRTWAARDRSRTKREFKLAKE